jgi:hypothetical protein
VEDSPYFCYYSPTSGDADALKEVAMENTVDAIPGTSRINFRIVAFGLLVLALIGWPSYLMVSETLSHGVHRASDGGYSVDLKAIGNFHFDGRTGTIDDVPSAYRALDGKKVVLTGFMTLVGLDARASNEFQFVYNIQNCCFNGPPLVQERVFAFLPKGQRMEILDGAAELTGILHVKVENVAGQVSSVYTMDVQRIRPL